MPISTHNSWSKRPGLATVPGGLLFLLVFALLILDSCSSVSITQTFSDNKAPAAFQKMFTVAGRVELDIDSDSARIHIHHGAMQQVFIKGTKHTAHNDTITINYAQHGSNIQITSRINQNNTFDDLNTDGTSNVESTYIDLDITTPGTTDTQIKNVAGTVDMLDLSGQEDISTEGGSINLQRTTLERSSRLETVAGAVTFDGAIAPQSENTFKTTAGSIDATLPGNAPVDVSISSMLGQVQNDFDAPASTDFNSSLHIENTTGSVLVHAR